MENFITQNADKFLNKKVTIILSYCSAAINKGIITSISNDVVCLNDKRYIDIKFICEIALD